MIFGDCMKNKIIFLSFFLTWSIFTEQTAQANGAVEFVVNKTALTFDAAKSISLAAYYVTQADATLKIINDQLSIVPSNALGDIIKIAADVKYIFISPLIDGRYFIQALTEGDYQKAAWSGLKIYTYFFNPICFQGMAGLEKLLTFDKIYQRAVEFHGKFKIDWEQLAKTSPCTIL